MNECFYFGVMPLLIKQLIKIGNVCVFPASQRRLLVIWDTSWQGCFRETTKSGSALVNFNLLAYRTIFMITFHLISYIWIFTFADDFFHHPFLGTTSTTKKCKGCVFFVSKHPLRAVKVLQWRPEQQHICVSSTGSPGPVLSYPSSGSGSSSSSSSTSHLASPQVCALFFKMISLSEGC